jgi:hypothetical protein
MFSGELRMRMSRFPPGQLRTGSDTGGGCWKDEGTPTCNALFIMQCIRGAAPLDTLCVIWELWA